MATDSILMSIIQAAEDVKPLKMLQIDMEGKSSLTDFIIICHGTSTAHTKGIADKIELSLKQQSILPLGIEGRENGEWILLDYNSIIVHIFLQEIREYYQLEALYDDSPKKNI